MPKASCLVMPTASAHVISLLATASSLSSAAFFDPNATGGAVFASDVAVGFVVAGVGAGAVVFGGGASGGRLAKGTLAAGGFGGGGLSMVAVIQRRARSVVRLWPRSLRRGTMSETARPCCIWLDGDACPKDVKEVVFRAASRTGRRALLVANKPMFAAVGNPLVQTVVVAGGPDVADDHIVAHAIAGDIVVTADIPLAARLVPLGVFVIEPRGEQFDDDNIAERLSVRDFMADVRDTGGVSRPTQTRRPAAPPRSRKTAATTTARLLDHESRRARRAARARLRWER